MEQISHNYVLLCESKLLRIQIVLHSFKLHLHAARLLSLCTSTAYFSYMAKRIKPEYIRGAVLDGVIDAEEEVEELIDITAGGQ